MDTEKLMKEVEAQLYGARGEQVRRGMMARARTGMPTGTVPLGYKIWGKRITVVEPAATYIQDVFRWLDEEHLPVRTAWRRATAAGLLSRRGQPLSASAFQLLVRNPFYAGFVRFGGELYEASHRPLISNELFKRVQDRITDAHHPIIYKASTLQTRRH